MLELFTGVSTFPIVDPTKISEIEAAFKRQADQEIIDLMNLMSILSPAILKAAEEDAALKKAAAAEAKAAHDKAVTEKANADKEAVADKAAAEKAAAEKAAAEKAKVLDAAKLAVEAFVRNLEQKDEYEIEIKIPIKTFVAFMERRQNNPTPE